MVEGSIGGAGSQKSCICSEEELQGGGAREGVGDKEVAGLTGISEEPAQKSLGSALERSSEEDGSTVLWSKRS